MLWLLSADAPYVSCQTAVVPVPASRFITLAKWPRAAEFSLGDSEALVEACEWESRMPWSGHVRAGPGGAGAGSQPASRAETNSGSHCVNWSTPTVTMSKLDISREEHENEVHRNENVQSLSRFRRFQSKSGSGHCLHERPPGLRRPILITQSDSLTLPK